MHGGESCYFRLLKIAVTCQNPSIQVRLSLIFPLMLTRLAWGLKQIPQKNESNMSIFCDFQDLVKKLLTSNRIFRLLVNSFLTRSLTVSCIQLACCCRFWGICYKPHANLTSFNETYKESLTCIDGVFNGIRHCCCCFEVT